MKKNFMSSSEEPILYNDKRLLVLYAFSALVVWLPLKAPPYALPFLAIIAFILLSRSKSVFLRLCGVLFIFSVFTLLNYLINADFYLRAAALTLICYGGIIFVFITRKNGRLSFALIQKIAKFSAFLLMFEGIIGICEAIYGFSIVKSFDINNGDWVKGTIGLTLHGLVQGTGFGNAMFAANIASLLLIVLVLKNNKLLRLSAIFIGSVSLILASVIHIILFFVTAISCSLVFLQMGRARISRGSIFGMFTTAVLLSLAVAVLSTNFGLIGKYSRRFLELKSPKSIVINRIFTEVVPNTPYITLIGAGPGQFASTGALIATGQYFGTPLHPDSIPLFPKHLTNLQNRYFYDQWLRQVSNRYLGSTQAPYFSLLSVFVEFGLMGVLFVLSTLIFPIILARRFFLRNPNSFIVALSLSSTGIFLVLLGLQVNYWGIPQASFMGFFNLAIITSVLSNRKSLFITHDSINPSPPTHAVQN